MHGHPAALPVHWTLFARLSFKENAMPPMVNDIPMSDATYADFVDSIKVLEAKGMSRADAIDKIVADGLKPQAKRLAEFRALAAAAGEVTGA